MARLIGMKDICNHTHRSESTILTWIRQMDFPAVKVGGIYEADTEDIDRWRDRYAAHVPMRVTAAEKKKKKIDTLV